MVVDAQMTMTRESCSKNLDTVRSKLDLVCDVVDVGEQSIKGSLGRVNSQRFDQDSPHTTNLYGSQRTKTMGSLHT